MASGTGGVPIPSPSAHPAEASPGFGALPRTVRAFATILGWHVLAVIGYVVWVLTWPDEVHISGNPSLDLAWYDAAVVLAIFVALVLAFSLAVACVAAGIAAVLLRRRRWSGIAVGMGANAVGLLAVAVALYAMAAQNGS